MATKIGFDQTGSPAPKWWRRLERSIIVIVAPAVAAMIPTFIADPAHQAKALALITFIIAIIKGIGMFLGTGDNYEGEKIQ